MSSDENQNDFADQGSQDFSKKNNKQHIAFLNEDIEILRNYLYNPTKSGIWKLSANWKSSGSFFRFIRNEIEQMSIIDKDYSFLHGSRSLKFNEVDKKYILKSFDKSRNRLTFPINLFFNIILLKKSKKGLFDDVKFDLEQIISVIIGSESLKNKYKKAYKIFYDNIYFLDMNPIIESSHIFKFNHGFIILDDISDDKINITSLNYKSLDIIQNFLKELDLIENYKIERIFSPEEIILVPYTTFLKEVNKVIVEYDLFQNLIMKCISEFESGSFSFSISTIGILVEDILIQIYETLIREVISKELTLGQLYDRIQKDTNELISTDTKEPQTSAEGLFKELNDLIKKCDESTEDISQKETLSVTRKILHFQNEQKNELEGYIRHLLIPEKEISIFPNKIKANINELIKYRNAISHKSRIPIGKYEAVKTIYCAINLLIWWIEEKNIINWHSSREEIINKFIERHS